MKNMFFDIISTSIDLPLASLELVLTVTESSVELGLTDWVWGWRVKSVTQVCLSLSVSRVRLSDSEDWTQILDSSPTSWTWTGAHFTKLRV